MSNGFPSHMVGFARRAARLINAADVFPDDTFTYTAANGTQHAIAGFTKHPQTLFETFHEVLVSVLGEMTGAAVAPAVFDVDEQGYAVHSIEVFPKSIIAETVLEKAEKKKRFPLRHADIETREWARFAEGLDPKPDVLDVEHKVWNGMRSSFSRTLPFLNWIYAGDPNSSNIILDWNTAQQAYGTAGADKIIPFYFCDFSDIPTEGSFHTSAQRTDTPFNRKDADIIATALMSWPTVKQMETRLCKAKGAETWVDYATNYPATLINPIFGPHLDSDAMRDTMRVIAAYSDEHIRGEVRRIVRGMEPLIEHPADLTKLRAYGEYMSNVLILRRDLLKEHMAPLLAHQGESPATNPFALFKDAAEDELRALKRQARQATRPAATPRKKRDKRNET